MKPFELFDRLSDAELLSVAKHHQDRFDRAWQTVMTSHHRSGRYIDASDTMDRHYNVLGQIARYIRDHRPASLYSDFTVLNIGL